MNSDELRVTPVAIPEASSIARLYASMDLADAYSIPLPDGTDTDPQRLANFIFSQRSAWTTGLMWLRDTLVAGFGLKTSRQLTSLGPGTRPARVGIFRIYSVTVHEIVLGEDDKHLDFRLSILCLPPSAPDQRHRLVASTVVHCHNRLGRAYIFLIAPFHRAIMRASLRRAARAGWPRAAEK